MEHSKLSMVATIMTGFHPDHLPEVCNPTFNHSLLWPVRFLDCFLIVRKATFDTKRKLNQSEARITSSLCWPSISETSQRQRLGHGKKSIELWNLKISDHYLLQYFGFDRVMKRSGKKKEKRPDYFVCCKKIDHLKK